MAEQLQAQQISQAYFVLRNTQRDNRRGQWLGFLTTILAMVCALGCLFLDYPWVALAFVSIPVMAVAKALVESAKAPTKGSKKSCSSISGTVQAVSSNAAKERLTFSGLPRELRTRHDMRAIYCS